MENSVKNMLIRRAVLLHSDNKTVPTHHEAISNLGFFLGETVLNEMSPMAKEMMGVGIPFPVAPKTVWLTPSDRIDDNIVLKPPPNEDVIKALTHEGILEIGSTVEDRLEKQWQARIKAAKKEVEDFERFVGFENLFRIFSGFLISPFPPICVKFSYPYTFVIYNASHPSQP